MNSHQPPPVEGINEAQKIVVNIDTLESSDAFQWFKEVIMERITEIEDKILDDDQITAEEREALRQQRKGMMEIYDRTKLDRTAQVAYLARYGINPGDIPQT